MKFVYPAVIKEENNRFTVRFPDLAECVAEGASLEEAIENAKEAEKNWIALELEEEGVLPEISAVGDIVTEENETVRNISATVKFTEGWEE
ncbi:MAG: type II toxin-antitoxin system HicB family antitoxin [Candidatus Avilachnospira sp.]|jgi:predicted RNase H-like HicB family nuclease